MLVLTGWRRVRGVAFVMAPSYANRLVGDCGISVASFRGKGYSGGGRRIEGGGVGLGAYFYFATGQELLGWLCSFSANQQRVFIKQGKSRHVTSATSDSKQSNPIIAVLK